jgi:hypothetical protein
MEGKTVAYKEVKLEKGGGKALYDALTDSNAATLNMRKAAAKKTPQTPAKKPAPKKK